MKIVCLFLLSFTVYFSLQLEASEEERLKCIDRLHLAFELQSRSQTYLDSYNNCILFNTAEAQLEKMGESKQKLKTIRNLWLWFRMYGHSCGLLRNPVQSPDEYISSKRFSISRIENVQKDPYVHTDPKQQRCLRDFLTGVGMMISGVFCVTVNPPVGGQFGRPLVVTGFGYMWNAMNNLVVDKQKRQARIEELERLKKQAEEAAEQ